MLRYWKQLLGKLESTLSIFRLHKDYNTRFSSRRLGNAWWATIAACVTGVDDSQSTYVRGGGLSLVGEKLSKMAQSRGVPFEFHDAVMSGCQVQREHLGVEPGFAVIVNFPYLLHRMPDESVSVENHRDRLLHLIKSLSPKLVTLVEQESNTNTSPFLSWFLETLDYYTAMFESIDAARPRDDKQRISTEQQCVARDIVNMIACEDSERVERHEMLGKWRVRMMMAGFMGWPISRTAAFAASEMLKGYDKNYKLGGNEGALLSFLEEETNGYVFRVEVKPKPDWVDIVVVRGD